MKCDSAVVELGPNPRGLVLNRRYWAGMGYESGLVEVIV